MPLEAPGPMKKGVETVGTGLALRVGSGTGGYEVSLPESAGRSGGKWEAETAHHVQGENQ